MALTKVTYVDNVTVIGASNLNAIQDEIIANGTAVANLSSGKVDKINGKGLSTNDFSDELALKLSNIEAGATHVEVDDELSENSTNAVQNKVVAEKIREIEGNDPYASFEEKTVSGAVANFPDGAKDIPVKSLVVNVDPVQDLHGYDNPWPAGGGKNKFNPNEAQQNKWINSTTGAIEDTSGYWITGFIPVKENDVVRFISKGSARNAWYNSDKSQSTYFAYSGGDTSVTAPEDGFVVCTVSESTIAFGGNFIVTINDSDTSYAPYSNICPITGHTGANVVRTGKNLCPNDLTWTSGTRSDVGAQTPSDYSHYSSAFSVKANTEYTISGLHGEIRGYRVYFLASDDSWISRSVGVTTNIYTFTTPVNCQKIQVQCDNNVTSGIQLELGSSATDYEAYTATTIPITFPDAAGTVYGGTLTNQGTDEWKLRSVMKSIDLGSQSWSKDGTRTIPTYYATISDIKIVSDGWQNDSLCSQYKASSSALVDMSMSVLYNGRLYIADSRYEDATAFSNGVNGVQFVYPLTTPIEYTLTGEVVETLLGVNNIWADTGDSTVTYRADPTISSKAKELVIKAIIAPVLTEMVADTALVANDFRIVGDTLYKITSNIASGGTLTVGTNCTATTIGEQLKALLNA